MGPRPKPQNAGTVGTLVKLTKAHNGLGKVEEARKSQEGRRKERKELTHSLI